MLKGQNIISSSQFNKDSILHLFAIAREMEKIVNDGGCSLLKGKILATLFYEPSTRTRFSFETAMYRLGGRVVSNPDMARTSSHVKRETLYDTGKVVSQMVDIIAMRHGEHGAVKDLAVGSDVPVINAGDGPGDHPTQGLLDLYTMWKQFGSLDGLHIAVVGDLKHSRAFHSEITLLKHFNVRLSLVSPEPLRLPQNFKDELLRCGIAYEEMENHEHILPDIQVLSTNRIQEERFENKAEFEKYRRFYHVNADFLVKTSQNCIVLNPLPRVDELSPEVDGDSRAKYFEQVKNGVELRMALYLDILGVNL